MVILLVVPDGRNKEKRKERDKRVLQECRQVQWEPETKGGSNRSNEVHGE